MPFRFGASNVVKLDENPGEGRHTVLPAGTTASFLENRERRGPLRRSGNACAGHIEGRGRVARPALACYNETYRPTHTCPASNIMNDPIRQPARSNEPPVAAGGTPSGTRLAADRLNIPSSIVRASGFAPGDKAFVADEDPAGALPKPCLVLLKEQPPKLVADYAVGKDCRIRVTPAILKKCGLEGRNFEIDGGDGKIVVRLRRESNAPRP